MQRKLISFYETLKDQSPQAEETTWTPFFDRFSLPVKRSDTDPTGEDVDPEVLYFKNILLPLFKTHGISSLRDIETFLSAAMGDPYKNMSQDQENFDIHPWSYLYFMLRKIIPAGLQAGVRDGKTLGDMVQTASRGHCSWQENEVLEHLIPQALAVGISNGQAVQDLIHMVGPDPFSKSENFQRLSMYNLFGILHEYQSMDIARLRRYMAPLDEIKGDQRFHALRLIASQLLPMIPAAFDEQQGNIELLAKQLSATDMESSIHHLVDYLTRAKNQQISIEKAIGLLDQVSISLTPKERQVLLKTTLPALLEQGMLEPITIQDYFRETFIGFETEEARVNILRDFIPSALAGGLSSPNLNLALHRMEGITPLNLLTPATKRDVGYLLSNGIIDPEFYALVGSGSEPQASYIKKLAAGHRLLLLFFIQSLIADQSQTAIPDLLSPEQKKILGRDTLLQLSHPHTNLQDPAIQHPITTLSVAANEHDAQHQGWGPLTLMEAGVNFLNQLCKMPDAGIVFRLFLHQALSTDYERLRFFTLVNESANNHILAPIEELLTQYLQDNPHPNEITNDAFLSALQLVNVHKLVATEADYSAVVPETLCGLAAIKAFSDRITQQIKNHLANHYHISIDSLAPYLQAEGHEERFRRYIIYLSRIGLQTEQSQDLSGHQKQLLAILIMALEFNGQLASIKNLENTLEAETMIETLFLEQTDRDFLKQYLMQKMQLNHQQAVSKVLNIDGSPDIAAVWEHDHVSAHEAYALSPLEVLNQFVALSSQLLHHLNPEEQRLLSLHDQFPKMKEDLIMVGRAVAQRQQNLDQLAAMTRLQQSPLAFVAQPIQREEQLAQINYAHKLLDIFGFMATLQPETATPPDQKKSSLVTLAQEQTQQIERALERLMASHAGNPETLGYHLKINDTDGISSYNGDLERLKMLTRKAIEQHQINPTDGHDILTQTDHILTLTQQAVNALYTQLSEQLGGLFKQSQNNLTADMVGAYLKPDAAGYLIELIRLVSQSSSTHSYSLLVEEHADFTPVLFHIRQCLNCLTGSNSDTNLTLLDWHRKFVTLGKPGLSRSDTDLILGLHVYSHEGSEGVALIPDQPYGTLSQSYLEALMDHVVEKADQINRALPGNTSVQIFIPHVVEQKFSLPQWLNQYQQDQLDDLSLPAVSGLPTTVTLKIPASASGQSYYEFDGHYARRTGDESITLTGYLIQVSPAAEAHNPH